MKLFTDLEVRVREFGTSITRRVDGATAVEYALMVALIAIVIIVAVTLGIPAAILAEEGAPESRWWEPAG